MRAFHSWLTLFHVVYSFFFSSFFVVFSFVLSLSDMKTTRQLMIICLWHNGPTYVIKTALKQLNQPIKTLPVNERGKMTCSQTSE